MIIFLLYYLTHIPLALPYVLLDWYFNIKLYIYKVHRISHFLLSLVIRT
jgi:hypothetical protein